MVNTYEVIRTKNNSSSSEPTDFPNNDRNAVEVHVTCAKKDSIGSYHVRGEIKNLSNDTLQFVKVTGHLYDAKYRTRPYIYIR